MPSLPFHIRLLGFLALCYEYEVSFCNPNECDDSIIFSISELLGYNLVFMYLIDKGLSSIHSIFISFECHSPSLFSCL